VYWHIFKADRPVGVRETQRALSLSSPSIALYHLEKLREVGILEKDNDGQYSVKETIQVGSLKMFLKVGHVILPRYLFYAVFLTTATGVYAAMSAVLNGVVQMPAVLLGVAGAGISWYECFRMWQERVI
jgi:DNA-binding transcriptional ArsR family regulator